eukprot:2819605-Karenia_brevis.AAC.1
MRDDDSRSGGQLQHSAHEILKVLCNDGEDNGLRGSPSSQDGRNHCMIRLSSGFSAEAIFGAKSIGWIRCS